MNEEEEHKMEDKEGKWVILKTEELIESCYAIVCASPFPPHYSPSVTTSTLGKTRNRGEWVGVL